MTKRRTWCFIPGKVVENILFASSSNSLEFTLSFHPIGIGDLFLRVQSSRSVKLTNRVILVHVTVLHGILTSGSMTITKSITTPTPKYDDY